jgi:xanthine dehydrogenase iron-sulfur cluster and FAD-binding subunit A
MSSVDPAFPMAMSNPVRASVTTICVDGRFAAFAPDDDRTLLEWLPQEFGVVSARPSCDGAHCGSCAVLVNGMPTKSCTVLLRTLGDAEVRTLDGYEASAGALAPLVEALAKPSVFQCGYCKPAFVFAAKALLEQNPQPGRREIQAAFNGLLCRCTGYQTIVAAVEEAAGSLCGCAGTAASVPPHPNPDSTHRPQSVADALALAKDRPDSRWLAGGQQLVPLLRNAARPTPALIEIGDIDALRRIEWQFGRLTVGAACTHAEIAASDRVGEALPELARLAGEIGDIYLRSRGTLGGAMVGAYRNGSYPSFLIAVDALIVTAWRRVAASAWFEEHSTRADRAASELIVAVELSASQRVSHFSFRPRPGRPALVGITGARWRDGSLRIGVSGYARAPFLVSDPDTLMSALAAGGQNEELVRTLGVAPLDDIEATGQYRAAILRHLLGRLRNHRQFWADG